MADSQRIDDLRRRVQKDPASIAFAQLAEECRRAGRVEEAVDVCRAGLAIHPGYLSARVTLGRALLEMNQLDDALQELTTVLKSAPENLAAIRGTAEIHHRRGDLADALAQYRAALALARNDPDLQQTVVELARQVEPPPPPPEEEGLSLEQITNEFLNFAPPPVVPPPLVVSPPPVEAAAPPADVVAPPTDVAPPPETAQAATPPAPEDAPPAADEAIVAEAPESGDPLHAWPSEDAAPHAAPAMSTEMPAPPALDPELWPIEAVPADAADIESPVALNPPPVDWLAQFADEPPASPEPHDDRLVAPAVPAWPEPSDQPDTAGAVDSNPDREWSVQESPSLDDSVAREEAVRTIAALEQWLDAIHVTRAQRHS